MPQEVLSSFVSYSREDGAFALTLAKDLRRARADVWIDQLDIEPGAEWDGAVEEALTKSPVMLVILSPVSVNSSNVRDEVSFALGRQKRVIPIFYKDCNVPFRLARLQRIDFRTDYQQGLETLLKAIGGPDPSTREPGPQQTSSSDPRSGANPSSDLTDREKGKERGPVPNIKGAPKPEVLTHVSGVLADRVPSRKRTRVLWSITCGLFVLWVFGFVGLYVSAWFHIFLILALGMLVFTLSRPKKS